MSDEYNAPPPYDSGDRPRPPAAPPMGQSGYPTAPPVGQQGYPTAPPAGYPAAPYGADGWQQQYAPVDPGKTLGIVGFVLAFVFALAGLIVSIIARSKSVKAGYKNGLATAGIWLSAIFLAFNIFSIIFLIRVGVDSATWSF